MDYDPPPPRMCVCVVRIVPGRDVSPEVRNHLANVLCRQLKLTTEVLYCRLHGYWDTLCNDAQYSYGRSVCTSLTVV